VVPTTEKKRDCGAYDISQDVEGVKIAAIIGEDGLDDFGANGQSGCASEEG
jgi:hypothetical protein